MYKSLKLALLFTILSATALTFISCGTDSIVNQIISNEVTAKQRLDSANAQASRDFPNSKLVMIFGRNVKLNGKTDIGAITIANDPSSIGSWLYIYRVPTDANLRVYTPNPLPGSSTNIELTAFFSVSEVVGLIQDTAARNLVSGALDLLTNANVNITTSTTNLIDSDVSLGLANTTNPIIKFDASNNLSASTENGNAFFASGTNETINMFLIPAAGTLNLPTFLTHLTTFPNDLWIVNYTKTDANNVQQNLILGTVVQSNQIIGINNLTLTSKVINISKYAQ